MGQKARWLEPGDAWPAPPFRFRLPLRAEAPVAPCHLTCGASVPGENGPLGSSTTGLLHTVLHAAERHTLVGQWRASPRTTPPPASPLPAAGLALLVTGQRQGATGVRFGLARPVEGPPETALGLGPRPVKRLDAEGERTCGGADQNRPPSAGESQVGASTLAWQYRYSAS
jgi:hypothetical protein